MRPVHDAFSRSWFLAVVASPRSLPFTPCYRASMFKQNYSLNAGNSLRTMKFSNQQLDHGVLSAARCRAMHLALCAGCFYCLFLVLSRRLITFLKFSRRFVVPARDGWRLFCAVAHSRGKPAHSGLVFRELPQCRQVVWSLVWSRREEKPIAKPAVAHRYGI